MSKTNQLTKKAGLHLNVNRTKSCMLSLYENSSLEKPLIRKSQIALTAILEHVCTTLMELCQKGMDKKETKEVTPKMMKRVIRSNGDFRSLFLVPLSEFDKSQMQSYDVVSIVCTSTKKCGKYMDAFLTEVTPNVTLNKKANTLMRYLLVCLFERLAMASYCIKDRTGNKSVANGEVEAAFRTCFRNPFISSLCKSTLQCIGDCVTKVDDKDEEEGDGDGKEEEGDDGEEEEEEKPKKKKNAKADKEEEDEKPKKNAKAPKKPVKVV
jgi:hypothetical protein